jgi:uncharacterized protein (TIGR02147 family)
MVFEHSSYRDFLKGVLTDRTRQNPRYSLRGLARQLGVQPSLLSEVMGGRRRLSEDTAIKIADRLGLEENEREYFQLLVRLDRAKTVELREATLKRIEKLHPRKGEVHDLAVDLFRTIADWYHFALLRLSEVDTFEWSNRAAAKALGVLEYEVEAALARMKRLELVEIMPDGRPRKLTNDLLVSSKVPNESLRKYHAHMLQKTIASLTAIGPKQRFTGTEDVVLNPEQISEASEIFEEAFKKTLALSARRDRSKASEVYHLGIHLNPLTALNERKPR